MVRLKVGRKETGVSLKVVNATAGAGLSVFAADLLGLSPPSPAEDDPKIEKYLAKWQLCGGKCLLYVRGQRSDWVDW